MTAQYIDIHCHVLPAVDDGPEDTETAVELVESLFQLGFAELHPTPHQRVGRWAPTAESCRDAAAALRRALHARDCTVQVHPPAAENMWDDLFWSRQETQDYPTYPGGKAFLLELNPDSPPPELAQRLFEFRLRGKLPVLAHVERYPGVSDNDEQLSTLGGQAALLINLSTVGGYGGFALRRRARRLLRRGLVHAATTDAHRADDTAYCAAGIKWIRNKLGEQALQQLLVDGPRSITQGELPELLGQ